MRSLPPGRLIRDPVSQPSSHRRDQPHDTTTIAVLQFLACSSRLLSRLLNPPAVPAEFWDADPKRDALATWHMGRVFYAYRDPAQIEPHRALVTNALVHRLVVADGRCVGVEYLAGGEIRQACPEGETTPW